MEPKVLTCSLCGVTRSSKFAMKRHQKNEHSTTVSACPIAHQRHAPSDTFLHGVWKNAFDQRKYYLTYAIISLRYDCKIRTAAVPITRQSQPTQKTPCVLSCCKLALCTTSLQTMSSVMPPALVSAAGTVSPTMPLPILTEEDILQGGIGAASAQSYAVDAGEIYAWMKRQRQLSYLYY